MSVRKLEQRFDGGLERLSELQRQHSGRHEHAILDGVDRFPRYADKRRQVRLSEIPARAFLAKPVLQSIMHRGARAIPDSRT